MCITIQINPKYLGQASQYLTCLPVGYIRGGLPVGYRVWFPVGYRDTGFPDIFIVCRGIFVKIANFIFEGLTFKSISRVSSLRSKFLS